MKKQKNDNATEVAGELVSASILVHSEVKVKHFGYTNWCLVLSRLQVTAPLSIALLILNKKAQLTQREARDSLGI